MAVFEPKRKQFENPAQKLKEIPPGSEPQSPLVIISIESLAPHISANSNPEFARRLLTAYENMTFAFVSDGAEIDENGRATQVRLHDRLGEEYKIHAATFWGALLTPIKSFDEKELSKSFEIIRVKTVTEGQTAYREAREVAQYAEQQATIPAQASAPTAGFANEQKKQIQSQFENAQRSLVEPVEEEDALNVGGWKHPLVYIQMQNLNEEEKRQNSGVGFRESLLDEFKTFALISDSDSDFNSELGENCAAIQKKLKHVFGAGYEDRSNTLSYWGCWLTSIPDMSNLSNRMKLAESFDAFKVTTIKQGITAYRQTLPVADALIKQEQEPALAVTAPVEPTEMLVVMSSNSIKRAYRDQEHKESIESGVPRWRQRKYTDADRPLLWDGLGHYYVVTSATEKEGPSERRITAALKEKLSPVYPNNIGDRTSNIFIEFGMRFTRVPAHIFRPNEILEVMDLLKSNFDVSLTPTVPLAKSEFSKFNGTATTTIHANTFAYR
jgi:hypothetical protein